MAIAFIPGDVSATNGLNLLGFGAESYMMGGADLAVARDTTALNTNPAGLIQIPRARLDIYNAVAFALDNRHQDRFGNNETVNNAIALVGDVGYARHLPDSPLTVGIGLFAQGGAGIEYERLNTAFGTRDELSIRLRIAKLSPGIAWRVNHRLSLGLAIPIVYSDMTQKVFPNTSFLDATDPSQSFFGSQIDGMSTVAVGYKLGALYRLNDRLRVGVAYTSPVELTLEGDRLRSNMSALGLGTVSYRKVTAGGIDQPREIGVGIAWQSTPRLLLSLELNWIQWSKAVATSRLLAERPDVATAPAVLDVRTHLNWRDQYVVALGTAYEAGPWTLRAGFNYGRNPVPRASMQPLLSPIATHHLTFGAGRRVSKNWRLDGGIEYQFKATARYTNPTLPFGPGARETVEMIAVHVMASRRW